MEHNDSIRISHMLLAINEAYSFSKEAKRKDLNKNRMLVLSLIKGIEIIGEAASKLSDDLMNRFPEIP